MGEEKIVSSFELEQIGKQKLEVQMEWVEKIEDLMKNKEKSQTTLQEWLKFKSKIADLPYQHHHYHQIKERKDQLQEMKLGAIFRDPERIELACILNDNRTLNRQKETKEDEDGT